VAPNDPVIVNNDDDDDSTGFPDVNMEGFTTSSIFDTQINFKWSRPNLSSSEYDGFLIDISTKPDQKDILITLRTGKDITEGCVKGLTADTTYYARGYFYKTVGGEKKRYGGTSLKTITTESKFTVDQINKMERLKANGLMADDPLVCVFVGDENDNKDDSNDSSTSTNSSNTSSSSSSSTKKVSSNDIVLPHDVKSLTLHEAYTELRALVLRINKLRNWIRKLNLELEATQ